MGSFVVAPGWSRQSLDDATEDCWRRAGLAAGMRVLDVGCGAGESTFLAATIVGSDGRATGVDRDHQALRRARQAADESWVANVEFLEADISSEELLGLPPFDAIVGRLFLVQRPDPAFDLRHLARLCRPQGVMAFVEAEFDAGNRSEPTVPLVDQAVGWLQAGYREAGVQMNLVTSFSRVFLEAGLGWPRVRAYQSALGSGSGQSWTGFAAAVGAVLPAGARGTGSRHAESTDLGDRLSVAVAEKGAAIAGALIGGAWVRTPAEGR